MFTAGTDITTAVTDLVNAVVATFLMVQLAKTSGRRKRDLLWVAAFASFVLVSVTGFCIHGLTACADYEINQVLRRILMVEMAYMLAFFLVAVLCDTYGEAIVDKALPVCLLATTAFAIVAVILMMLTSYGFKIFVVYCIAILVGIIIVLARHRSDKDGLSLYLVAAILLTLANVVQSIKSIRFTLVWDFNYNAVYHWILLLFVLVQYRAIRRLDA